MGVDSYYYFLIVLGGFALVWSYRKGAHSTKPISEFEYLCFSCIWGILEVVGYVELVKYSANAPQEAQKLLENPFATAIVMTVFGLILGFTAGRFVWEMKDFPLVFRALVKKFKK